MAESKEKSPVEKSARNKGGKRLFFAIELSDDVRSATADLESRLQKAAHFTPARIVWVPPQNFHITLWFLGDVGPAEKLAALLPEAVKEMEPFELDFRHLGTFPPDNRPPKVLWVGVHNPPEALTTLREKCASIIARAGLPIPDPEGAFHPHVTIARFKSSKGVRAVQKQLETYKFAKLGKSLVSRLVLKESITGGGPARYEPYATADFPGGEA